MTRQQATIVFDVNETLSDLSPVAAAFEHLGASRELATTWFATVLRDGFALTTSGGDASFPDIASNNARDLLSTWVLPRDLDESVNTVMTAFTHAPPHPDVADGLQALHAAGHRLFTLSNGPTTTAERLLDEAGARGTMEELLTVDGHSPWKPARSAYTDARGRIGGSDPFYLAAVHPWDVHGAANAGLSTIWINRSGRDYPAHFSPPTLTVSGVDEITTHL